MLTRPVPVCVQAGKFQTFHNQDSIKEAVNQAAVQRGPAEQQEERKQKCYCVIIHLAVRCKVPQGAQVTGRIIKAL